MSNLYSTVGLVVSALFLLASIACMHYRHAGYTRLNTTVLGFKIDIRTSTPATVLAILAVLVVFLTRPL